MDSAITLAAGPAAFGDGKHPTTAMILHALESLDAAQFHPRSICDMGAGSGILAIRAAQKFPRATTLAVDIEASAVAAIRENARANHVPGILAVHAGSFRHPQITAHAPYDLVLMNILAEPLLVLAYDAAAILNHEGILILSGILAWQQDQIIDAYQRLGLCLTHRLQQGDWVALLWVKLGL
ncbi:MAG: 50S ribosomal protein L11 methyltransferase [Alphaproteobacteria bacterium]|jgi:ribosomal protein L11 methyltransferase